MNRRGKSQHIEENMPCIEIVFTVSTFRQSGQKIFSISTRLTETFQACFSTTQQLFSSLSDPKKRTCISKNLHFVQNKQFPPKMWEVRMLNTPKRQEKTIGQCA